MLFSGWIPLNSFHGIGQRGEVYQQTHFCFSCHALGKIEKLNSVLSLTLINDLEMTGEV